MREDVSLPTYYFGHVISVLTDAGIGVEQWLASQGLDLSKLLLADARVSIQQFDGLMNAVIESRGFEHLGLSVGKRLEIAHHGDFGLAILNSATLNQVLDFHTQFLSIRIPLIQLKYATEGNQVVISLIDEHWQHNLHKAMIEAVMIAVVNMLDAIKFQDGSHLLIDAVDFDYAKPAYWEKYNTIKANQLAFDATSCTLRFARTFLNKPLASADEFSFKVAVTNCQKELNTFSQQHRNVVERVLTLLKQDLGLSRSLDNIADELHISKRSLHRKLEREGTSFKSLMQRVRAETAISYLQKGYTVAEVAEKLSYSDSANFRRAFKTWFGIAPKDWLAKNRKSDAQ